MANDEDDLLAKRTVVPFTGRKKRKNQDRATSGAYVRRVGLGRWKAVVDNEFLGFFPSRLDAIAAADARMQVQKKPRL